MSESGNPRVAGFLRPQFRFFTPSPTRWGDCDMFGHVNNVQFVRYYESGRLDYFHRVLDMPTVSSPEETLIIADIHVNFLNQIHHPSELAVGSRIASLGNSSFVFEAAIFIDSDDTPCSTARATCVWFDYRSNQSLPIPPAARRQIRQFEGIET